MGYSELATGNWLLLPNWFSKSCSVVQPYISARSLLGRIDDATIKGTRIDVQRDRPLIPRSRIHHPMHRLPRIDRARIRRRQLHRVRCGHLTLSRLNILKSYVEIFYQQAPHRSRHPAILPAMIVHRTALPNLPADGEQFVEIRLVDEIAREMLP